jgi:hypothetical protein
MVLVIEDGSGVAGANSYIDVTAARAYASARGLSLPAADADVEVLLIKAMDFIEAFRTEFQGLKTDAAQALQWPRTGATLDGYEVASDTIPTVLASAQAQLAADANLQELMPTGTGREVVMEKVDVISVQYTESGDTNPQPIFTKAEALLKPLLKRGLFGSLRSLRV